MDSIESQELLRKNIIEALIKVAVLGVMAVWTFQLIRPFLVPFVWGIILAVAAEPLIAWFTSKAGGRRTLAAVLFVLSIVALLVIPTIRGVMQGVVGWPSFKLFFLPLVCWLPVYPQRVFGQFSF